MAQRTWAKRWRERRIVVFIDNDSARHALIRGGSPSPASAELVSLFWATEAQLRSYCWVERVPTASNVADGPSRLSFAGVRALGARWSEPRAIQARELANQWMQG